MSIKQPVIAREEFDLALGSKGGPRTLPGHVYSNPDFFTAEVEHVFKAQWFPVAHEQMLPDVGDFYTIDLFGEKMVVVRGDDSEIRVLNRCCLQTGRDLFLNPFTQGNCQDVLGNVWGHRSWVYNLRGHVIEGDSPANSALPIYALENWQGFLLVNIDGKAAPYGPELKSLEKDLANYGLSELSLIRQPVIFDMQANWKLVAENYIEAYHHLATHKDSFERVSPARGTFTDDLSGKVISLRMPIKVDFESAFNWALPPIATLDEDDLSSFSAHLALPLFLLTPVHNSVAWLQLVPVSEERSFWMIYMLAPSEYLQKQGDIQQLFNSSVDIHNEDMDACIGNQKGFRSRFFGQGYIHPELEKGVAMLDRHVLEMIARADPALIAP